MHVVYSDRSKVIVLVSFVDDGMGNVIDDPWRILWGDRSLLVLYVDVTLV